MRRAFAGLVAGFLVSIACAQDEDAVVITATRFPDSKRDLPVGITLISADDIRRSASSNLGEILAQFGLLQVRDLAGTQNQQLDLRGFGITGDQNTLVLLDGVRMSENELESAQLSTVPIESIERIEIVRGGGAVLYGGGATGGTINIITRRAVPGEARGRAQARAGGYGTKEARLGLERQDQVLGGALAFSAEETDGYRHNSRYRQASMTGRLDARFDRGRGFLKLAGDEQRQRLPGALTEAQIEQDRRQTRTPDDWRSRDGGHVVLGGTHELGRHEVSGDLGYREKRTRSFFALFGGFYTDTQARLWSFAPRTKLIFDAGGRSHELVAGIDVDRWDYETLSASNPASTGAPFSRRLGEQDSRALYAQANVWLADARRMVLGARAQRVEERLAEEVFPLDDRRRASTLHAYEAALRQGFGRGIWGYAKYGSSFRVANFDENACFFPPCAASLLKPQTAIGTEIGAEIERSGLRARASVYQIDLEDEIYFSPLAFANINLAPTRRRGAEVEALWRATRSLELRAAAALLDARFRSGIYGGVDVSGKRVPLVPDSLVTCGAAWSFSSGSRLSLNLRYVGSQRFDNDQANSFAREQPAYALADIKLEHRVERIDVALEVRNVLDRKYYSYGTWNGADSFSALPAPERAAYLSLAYRLD